MPDDTTAGQAADEVAGEVANEAGPNNTPSPTRSRSGVWDHFDKLPDSDGKSKVECHYCSRTFVSSNGGTGNMWKHLQRAHSDVPSVQQLYSKSRRDSYPHEEILKGVIAWFVKRNQPFSEADAPEFREMMHLMNPGFGVPSGDTIRNSIDKHFGKTMERVRAMLKDAPGRLSFAVDAWTSPNTHAFLGITVHWIDADWQLRSMLLNIAPISDSHTGKHLSTIFKDTCQEFGVMDKLLAITTDNARNNDTLLEHLGETCRHEGVPFDRNSMHVRCIAHVINLAVQDFLGTLNAAAMDCGDAYDGQYSADAGHLGFIPRLRKLVIDLRDTPQRRERFANQCKTDQVDPKQLILDVRTRWNSTHNMIERALELRKPLDNMAMDDPGLAEYKLTAEEWDLLKDILGFLKVFKTASNHLCAASHPTLSTAVPVYNYLLDKLEDYRDSYKGPGAVKEAANAAIDKLKRYYSKTGAEVYAVATILDPSLKLDYYRGHEWEPEWIEDAKTTFKNAFARYHGSSEPDGQEWAPTEWGNGLERKSKGVAEHFAKRRRTTERDELEEYLAARPAAPGTDILQWWKANATTYPNLAKMARDYLAIPATSVPVERVFSNGTDLVQPKRGSLSAATIKTCMCLNGWMKMLQ
jgi:ribosomal protein S27E